MTIKNKILGILLVFQLGCATKSHAIDLVQFEKELTSETGVVGEVHGADTGDMLYVFAYRDEKDFFNFTLFSLIPKDANVLSKLKTIKRHDKVRLKGKFLEVRSAQKHIEVADLQIEKAFENPHNPREYKYEVELPKDLISKSEEEFIVHAVLAEGMIVVLEYKDKVVPLRVRPDQVSLVKDLYRNDLIRLSYKIAAEPEKPHHLKINTEVAEPVKVVERMLPKHMQPADLTGELILFPKSPQVVFDVFAVLEKLPSGNRRQYTLVNFDNKEVFAAIRKKCADAWAAAPNDFENGRNKLVHRKIKVRAKGKFNVVDANQANVQILIEKAEDLEVL